MKSKAVIDSIKSFFDSLKIKLNNCDIDCFFEKTLKVFKIINVKVKKLFNGKLKILKIIFRYLKIKTIFLRKKMYFFSLRNYRKITFCLIAFSFFFGYKNYDAESNMISRVEKDPVFVRIEKIIEEKSRTDKMFKSMEFNDEIENLILEKNYLAYNSDDNSAVQSSEDEGFIKELSENNIVTKIDKMEYVTVEGDTINSIADVLHRTSAEIASFNRDYSGKDSFEAGIKLRVRPIDAVIYEVNSGESIASIADRYKVSAEDIKAINGKNDYLVIPGEKIFIPYTVTDDKFSAPLDNMVISSPYGTRIHPIKQYELYHMGIDFVTPVGSNVYAGREGEVVCAGYEYGYGNVVKIEHDDGYYSIYGHLSELYVKVGDIVAESQLIAASGNTGLSTGPHLHFEVRKDGIAVNPAALLEKYKEKPMSDLKTALTKAKKDIMYSTGVAVRGKDSVIINNAVKDLKLEIDNTNYISSRL